MNKILEMNHITKFYGPVCALKDVSCDIREGEIHALVGENGAGKSTLMKILSGSIPKNEYEGSIMVSGKETNYHSTFDSEQDGIEMIYQEVSLHLDLTIAENIFLGHLIKKKSGLIDWKKVYEEAQKVLQLVGLDLSPKLIIRSLNMSQCQMIAIARALARNPKILVLDEPTSSLTEKEASRLIDIICNLRRQGISCIYISHKMDEVFQIADRITVLRDGSTISTYEREQFDVNHIIEDMVGRKMELTFPVHHATRGEQLYSFEHFTIPSKVNRKIMAVDDVSIHINRGEIVGIGGLVGAGRSEFVEAVFGATEKKSGTVRYNGQEITINSPSDAISHGIGFLTEDRARTGLVQSMCIRENISLASFKKIFTHGFIQRDKERQETENYAKQTRIKAPGIETNVMNLSGGNQQKVILSKWLMSDIELLILDEPTRGIDVGAKQEIYCLMNQLVEQGMSIILISSELPEFLGMCDRFYILCAGKLIREFQKGEIDSVSFMRAAAGYKE